MKHLFIISVLILCFVSCNQSDIDNLKEQQSQLIERIDALEEWQNSVNEQLSQIQKIVRVLESYDYITSISPLSNNEGYVIKFNKSGEITIKNGEKGEKPIITTKKIENQYYWIIDGEFLLDEEGDMIPVSGVAPQVKIDPQTHVWYISTDNGETWISTYINATGDSIFAPNGCTINDDHVNFTLSDGTTFKVPLFNNIRIGDNSTSEILSITNSTTKLPIILPENLKEKDFVGMYAKLLNEDGEWIDIKTRNQINDFWDIEINMPTFSNGVCDNNASVTIINLYPFRLEENLVLDVYIMLKDGNKISATRMLKSDFKAKVGDFYYSDGTYSTDYIENKNCIGVIFYTGDIAINDATLRNKIGNTSTGNHGFVIALNRLVIPNATYKWGSESNNINSWISTNTEYSSISDISPYWNQCQGYNNTKAIEAYNNYVNNNIIKRIDPIWMVSQYNVKAPSNSSGWFLPCVKEATLILTGDINITDFYNLPHTNNLELIKEKFSELKTFGYSTIDFSSMTNMPFWLSNEATSTSTATYVFRPDINSISLNMKNHNAQVIPILAF